MATVVHKHYNADHNKMKCFLLWPNMYLHGVCTPTLFCSEARFHLNGYKNSQNRYIIRKSTLTHRVVLHNVTVYLWCTIRETTITELILPEPIPHNHMQQIFWYNFCNMSNYTTSLKISWLLMRLELTTRPKTLQAIWWWCPITRKCASIPSKIMKQLTSQTISSSVLVKRL
jgi:hypothetical protein